MRTDFLFCRPHEGLFTKNTPVQCAAVLRGPRLLISGVYFFASLQVVCYHSASFKAASQG
jgi:hypothetical protein